MQGSAQNLRLHLVNFVSLPAQQIIRQFNLQSAMTIFKCFSVPADFCFGWLGLPICFNTFFIFKEKEKQQSSRA